MGLLNKFILIKQIISILKMKIIFIFLIFTLVQCDMNAQKDNSKVLLPKGKSGEIKFKNLRIKTLLQIYDESAASHLVNDVNLIVDDFNTDEIIAEYYIDADNSGIVFYTQLYKNYFFTFKVENNNYYLFIEEAKLERAFMLRHETGKVKGLNIKIIKDSEVTFWGTDAPDSDEVFFETIQTVKFSTGLKTKKVSFSSSEIKDGYSIEIGKYRIVPLSLTIQPSRIEMIVYEKNK